MLRVSAYILLFHQHDKGSASRALFASDCMKEMKFQQPTPPMARTLSKYYHKKKEIIFIGLIVKKALTKINRYYKLTENDFMSDILNIL